MKTTKTPLLPSPATPPACRTFPTLRHFSPNSGSQEGSWGLDSPTVRKAVARAEPCSLLASQRIRPARSGPTFRRRSEPQPARGAGGHRGSGPAGGGLCAPGGSPCLGGLSSRPLLSYQRIRGAGRPVALQDRVTSPPATTVVLAGEEMMMGTESLPGGKHKQRMNSTKGYDT